MNATRALTFVALIVSTVLMQACSNPGAATDGGDDATPNACPTYSGSNSFCQGIVAHCMQCGLPSIGGFGSCSKSNFTQYILGVDSMQCLNVLFGPWAGGQCNPGGECNVAALADASLTAAQAKAADDYCVVCGDSGACSQALVSTVGLNALNDALCSAIDQACTPDASSACDDIGYGSCAAALVTAKLTAANTACHAGP